MEILKPHALEPGSTIGVFTPSRPAYRINEGLFANGLKNLEKLGFRIRLGSLTAARASQGYRSGSPVDRAREMMDLVEDPTVDAIMSTIGGANSSSMIPYLDFDAIRRERKLFCGYSDVTSLHLAILKFAGLRTVYGPSVMCWFGDWPDGIPESAEWFLEATMRHRTGERTVLSPSRWSNHARNWTNGDWQKIPRQWQTHSGWKVLSPGRAAAPILALNLNTLLTAAGTAYWPELNGKILLIEDMDAPLSETERELRQLVNTGALEQISGLVVGRPEVFKDQGSGFSYHDILQEVIGPRPYPVVADFDCGHCVPMISIPQLATVRLSAEDAKVDFRFTDGPSSNHSGAGVNAKGAGDHRPPQLQKLNTPTIN